MTAYDQGMTWLAVLFGILFLVLLLAMQGGGR